MVFSEMHDWQGDPAVKQILVFPSELEKKDFELNFAERVKKAGIVNACDSGIGAIFKLRAVMNAAPRSYTAIIRSGHDGDMIIESWNTYDSEKSAMAAAIGFLKEYLIKGYDTKIKTLQEQRESTVVDLDSLVNTL